MRLHHDINTGATARRGRQLHVLVIAALFGLSATGAVLAANGSVGYTYDALGRLTTANYDTGVCLAYAYDANGNRLTQTITVGVAPGGGVWGCFNWGQAPW